MIKNLCRTYTHTTTKLMYAFAALSEQRERDADVKNINDALVNASRADLMEQISSTLTTSVERILRNSDLSMRTGVLRDLRARFAPKEKVEMVEQGTQVSGLKKKAGNENDTSAEDSTPYSSMSEPTSQNIATAEVAAAEPKLSATQIASATGKQPAGSAMTVAIYERLKAWEAQKKKRIEQERVREEEREKQSTAPPKRRSSARYEHVQSVLKKEADKKVTDEFKLIEAARQLANEEQARADAEARASHSENERVKLEQDLEAQELKMQAVEQQLEQTRMMIAREQQEKEALRKEAEEANRLLEIEQALEGRALEVWPMIPNRKVLRVADSEEFDGRVSAEYRVKDMESGERGVSLLMGRNASTRTSEPQCVLFDPNVLSDLQAARWWVANRHRFDKRGLRRSSSRLSTRYQ